MKILTVALLTLAFSTFAFGQTKTIKIYIGNENKNPNSEDCNKVFPVTRKIKPTKAVAFAALQELFKGETETEKAAGYYSFSPENSKGILKSVKITSGAAYVNFNGAILTQMGNYTTSCGSAFFFSSIEKTLKQFPTIKKVFFAVEGKPREFYEWMQGDCPKELKKCSGKNF